MTSQAVVSMIDEQLLPYEIHTLKTEIEIKTVLNEVSNRICVHACKNLNSKDNITMAIILLQWRPHVRVQSSIYTQNSVNKSQQMSRNNSLHIDHLISEVSDALLTKGPVQIANGINKPTSEVLPVLKDDEDVMKFLVDDANF